MKATPICLIAFCGTALYVGSVFSCSAADDEGFGTQKNSRKRLSPDVERLSSPRDTDVTGKNADGEDFQEVDGDANQTGIIVKETELAKEKTNAELEPDSSPDQREVKPTSRVRNKKHFDTLWFEPLWHDNYTSYEDIYSYLAEMKIMGFRKIVIAYTFYDWGQCFLYTPQENYSFLAFNVKNPGSFTTTSVDSQNPQKSCDRFEQLKNFTSYFFQASEKLDLQIIVGLSRTGDVYLLNDIYHNLKGNNSSKYLPGYDVNRRLRAALSLSQSAAKDIWQQFGKSSAFGGWYLAHETHCLDVGANYYDPMARYLKSLDSKKTVMISPTIDATVCFGGSMLDFVKKRKDLIDVYSYQDTLGAGTMWINGGTKYMYTASARTQRLNQIKNEKIGVLATIHRDTGTEFQMNVEGWEMDGSCGYGCSYGGDWQRIQGQLDAYIDKADSLMLNEGFLLFQFDQPTLAHKTGSKRERAAKSFTEEYRKYLGVD